VLALEQEVANKQALLDSANRLEQLGFTAKDLDDLGSAIRMIANTRNVDQGTAKERLVSDLHSYYANDQELRARIRTLEALVREKEDKFSLLESDFRNEQAVLDSASKLISGGLDEKWLEKLRKIIDSYGIDIDLLAKELQNRNGLNASIENLVKTKKTLEEEERLLRQKVVATEDQRIKTLSLINDMILHAPGKAVAKIQPDPVKEVSASLDDVEFRISAQKAIEIIRERLPPDSPASLVLAHALMALRRETARKE
jgi:hypothetical protein